jgi:hypothetical protein
MATAYQRLVRRFFPKSLAANLADACASVSGVLKKGDNGTFTYLRILDVANALRDELFSRGIVIIPSDVECNLEMFESDVAGRRITEVRVKTEFTLTDGRSEKVYAAYGVGRDMDGKALFAAQTGALKSWLKRLGLIFGDRDDPEIEQRATPELQDELPRQKLAQARYQARAWSAALATCGRTEPEIEAILSEAMGREVTSGLIIALPREGFDVAMKILTQHSDLTKVLEDSKRAAKRRKTAERVADTDAMGRKKARGPQPIVEALDQPSELTGD